MYSMVRPSQRGSGFTSAFLAHTRLSMYLTTLLQGILAGLKNTFTLEYITLAGVGLVWICFVLFFRPLE